MGTKERLNSRNFDELVELAERLAEADNDLRWALIEARKRAGYTQRELADVLGVRQPTIAEFERQENDPKLSTLRRYALAVGAEVCHKVRISDGSVVESSTWGSSSAGSFTRFEAKGEGSSDSVRTDKVAIVVEMSKRSKSARSDYVLAA